MTLTARHSDVMIVGAGLVGAALALRLARHQPALAITVLESAGAATQFEPAALDPRVVALTPASVALLRELGVWSRVQAQRACAYTDMAVWDAEGTGRIDFSARDAQVPELGFIVENSLLVSELQQALSYLPNVALRLGEQVAQLALPVADAADAFGPTEVCLASGERHTASLLLAADGAHSTLRALAGMPTREWDYGQHAIVTTVNTERPHGQVARQRFLSDGPVALLPLATTSDPGHWCALVWSATSARAEQLMALSDAAFCAQLTRDSEACLGQVHEVARRQCFPLWQRHAVDYCRPGLALVGDAAHSIHPLAGQGVNLGLQDVRALAAEIERAQGRGLPLGHMATLRRYQRARKADNLLMMAGMEGFKRLFGAQSPWLRWLRNAGMRRVSEQPLLKRTIIRRAMGPG